MKIYGTFTCGHEGKVEVYGTKSQREWQEKKAFACECPECEERTKAAISDAAAAEAEAMDFKPLTGSVKQIAWANTIRKTWIDRIDSITAKWTAQLEQKVEAGLNDRPYDELIGLMHAVIDAFMSETSSRFWIDTRNACNDDEVNIRNIAFYCSKNKIEVSAHPAAENTEPDNIVRPEEVTHEGTAKVECTVSSEGDAVLVARYPKDDTFRSIVKAHRLTWNGEAWTRKITMTSAPIEDRAAELANALIGSGFAVKISPEAKDRLLNGTFQPECRRWIAAYAKTKLIARFDRDAEINEAVKDIGGRWDSAISAFRLDPSKYSSIEKFADTFGFRISDGAKKMLDEHRSDFDEASTVAYRNVSNEMETVMNENGLIGDLIDD